MSKDHKFTSQDFFKVAIDERSSFPVSIHFHRVGFSTTRGILSKLTLLAECSTIQSRDQKHLWYCTWGIVFLLGDSEDKLSIGKNDRLKKSSTMLN